MLGSVRDPLDAQKLARALRKLPGVNTAEVLSGPRGIEEVKVLVAEDRDEDEAVGDVLATAAITLDIDLPPESVIVIGEEPRDGPSGPPRVRSRDRLSSVAVWNNEGDVLANISLDGQDRTLEGEHRSLNQDGSRVRPIAEATLDAVAPLLRSRLHVSEASIVTVGKERVAVVLMTDEKQLLVGAAAVRVDENDAVARATLDAVNRWFT
ncbi:MAG: hypothetical protein ACLGHL_09710 [Actinomycetota bacterium]